MIFGGSGLTGKKITRILLSDKRYEQVILLLRKPMDFIHQNLEQIPFDFDSNDYVFPQVDEVIVCLGTTMKAAGSEANFRKVDHDYIVKIARQAHKQGIKRFALISAIGADKNSRFFYNRVKAETEEVIKNIGFEVCLIFQPSLLVGVRKEARLKEDISGLVMSVFSFLLPNNYKPVNSKVVAISIHKYLNDENVTGTQIIKSGEIRKNSISLY